MLRNRAPLPLWQQILGTIVIISLTCVIRFKFLLSIDTNTPFLLSYPAVVLSVVYAGYWAGVLATLVTALYSLLWLDPIGHWAGAGPLAWVSVVIFTASGILISYLFKEVFGAQRQAVEAQAALASEREQRISAIQEAEQEAREHAMRLKAVLDAAPAIIWTAEDRDCRTISGNLTASRFLRLAEGDNMSKTDDDQERLSHYRVFSEGRELAPEELPIQRVAATGNPLYNYPMEVVFSDGSKHYLLGNVVPVHNGGGVLRGAVAAFLDITERRRAEQALRESEKLLRTVVENIPAGLSLADANGNVTLVNPTARYIWGGLAAAERIMDYQDLHGWWADSGRKIEPHEWGLSRAVREGISTFSEEIVIETLDGKRKTILNSSVPVYDRAGKLMAAIATFQDITERKRTEEELRRSRDELELRVEERTAELARANEELKESEERLKLVLEGSQLGFWDWNIETGLVKRNERWAEMLGYTLEEIEFSVDQWTDLHHPEDRAAAWKSIEDHLKGLTPVHEVEYRMRAKDGQYRWILDRAKVVKRDSRGNPLRMSGTHTDITKRKQMEDALRRSEEKFSKAFHHAPLMMSLSRLEDGVYLEANERFFEISGFSREEVIGESSVELGWISEKDRVRLREELEAVGRVDGVEVTLRTKEGREVHCLYNGELIETESHPVLLSIAQDITELRSAQEELKAYTLELERSNRELEDFAFITSHDLHEPLRKIQAFSDRVRSTYSEVLDEQGRDWLQRIHRAAQRMRDLVEDLRRYSRLSSTGMAESLSPVNLKEPVEDAVRDLRVLMEETGGRVEMGELPTIQADAVQMRQLFQNLIENALKFHGSESPQINIHSAGNREGVCDILVEDQGIGFSEEYLDRIFRPFQQLHKRYEYEGTGMGLAICKKIVERHGGVITAKSRPGMGTTFIITLPLEQQESHVGTTATASRAR